MIGSILQGAAAIGNMLMDMSGGIDAGARHLQTTTAKDIAGWTYQNQIPMMVQAAKAAGIHPLAALGVNASMGPTGVYGRQGGQSSDAANAGAIGSMVDAIANRKDDAYYKRHMQYNEMEQADATTKRMINEARQSEMDTIIKYGDMSDVLNYGAKVVPQNISVRGDDGVVRRFMNPAISESVQDTGKWFTLFNQEWRPPMRWTNKGRGEFKFQRPWK